MAGDERSTPDRDALAKLQEEVAETQLPDPILRVLVSVCNRGSLTFTITVAQGGLVIAGTAVGVGRFMHDLAAEIETRGGTDAAVLSDPLRYLAQIAAEPDPGDDPTEDLPGVPAPRARPRAEREHDHRGRRTVAGPAHERRRLVARRAHLSDGRRP